MVAEKIISQIEAGLAPWQRPWNPKEPADFLPLNPTTGKRYKGINSIWLMACGYEDSRWMTYKQAQSLGAQVRKGEKATQIQYWKMTEDIPKLDGKGNPILDENGQPEKTTVRLERPKVFLASVFNAEQIDGLPEKSRTAPDAATRNWDVAQRAEDIMLASGAKRIHKEQDTAFYRESDDTIYLPKQTQFDSAEKYYATALHELGHWTGHASRLARDLNQPHGSEGYAREELRAEIASMMLGQELGIGHDPAQHAAYAGAWAKVLKTDSLEIFRAAADAEKILNHVMAFDKKQEQTLHSEQKENRAYLQQPAAGKTTATEAAEKLFQPSELLQQKKIDEQIARSVVKDDWSQANPLSMKHFGFRLPANWNGQTEVRGCIRENDNTVRSQLNAGEKPRFYGLYLQRKDGRELWVADFERAPEAFRMRSRLDRLYQTQREITGTTRAVAPERTPSPVPEMKTSATERHPQKKEKELQL